MYILFQHGYTDAGKVKNCNQQSKADVVATVYMYVIPVPTMSDEDHEVREIGNCEGSCHSHE